MGKIVAGFFLGSALATFGLCLPGERGAASEHPEAWSEVRSPHFVVAGDAGDKKQRHIAQQFEQLRTAFHSSFPTFRVDLGQPIVVIAVKNEEEMKEWLPQYWAEKGHFHPRGVYISTAEKDFVILRTDPTEENPYHTLCHEYAHALLHLNFHAVPSWLGEGLAEFFGNCYLGDKEVRVGQIDRNHLRTLTENPPLTLEELLRIGQDSPYYSEENRASVFYAESWAWVHYLMLDPQARVEQRLVKFLEAWRETGDQAGTATRVFGDTQRFDNILRSYVRQPSFSVTAVPISQESRADSYSSRTLSAAETLVLRGDLYVRREQTDLGREILAQALQMEPDLAVAHEAMGFYFFRQKNYEAARREAEEAIRLHGPGFLAPYLRGAALIETHSFTEEGLQAAQDSLEESIRQNPGYAPAQFRLSLLYSRNPKTLGQAILPARRATELEPGSTFYLLNLGDMLALNYRDAEARNLAEKILKSSHTAIESRMAQEILTRVQEHEIGVKSSLP